jgi:hypothetical protein
MKAAFRFPDDAREPANRQPSKSQMYAHLLAQLL